jgi:hypothetical protein
MQPAVDLWRNTDGLRVQEFRTLSPDPAPIQAFLANIKQQADAAGEAYPLVLLVGDANEGGEPAKNILSMFYSPDPTGGAFFTDEYPTDDPYADFNSDGVSDFNLMRIPADRPVEVTNAVQTYLACRAQGFPDKSLLLLTGDVEEGGNPADGVVLGAHEVRNRYEMAGFQVDQLLDSSFPFNDLGPRQQAFAAQISAGVSEVWGRAPLTNRSIWPGYFAQKANQPPWNWDWVTSGGAPFIFWAPGCDLADVDRNNPVFDPTLAESFLFIGPAKRSAVAVVSCGRGAYGVVHDLFEQTLLEARFSGYHATALDVFWEAKREFARRYPGLLGYVQAMTYLGWPAPLSGVAQTGVAETSPVPQARLEVSPNPFRVSTTIRFALAERSPVKVEVYDISGRLVTQLVNDVRSAGEYVVPWTGQRHDGTTVAQGMYFVRAITAGLQRTAPITIIR